MHFGRSRCYLSGGKFPMLNLVSRRLETSSHPHKAWPPICTAMIPIFLTKHNLAKARFGLSGVREKDYCARFGDGRSPPVIGIGPAAIEPVERLATLWRTPGLAVTSNG
jgi:hypothetical protein